MSECRGAFTAHPRSCHTGCSGRCAAVGTSCRWSSTWASPPDGWWGLPWCAAEADSWCLQCCLQSKIRFIVRWWRTSWMTLHNSVGPSHGLPFTADSSTLILIVHSYTQSSSWLDLRNDILHHSEAIVCLLDKIAVQPFGMTRLAHYYTNQADTRLVWTSQQDPSKGIWPFQQGKDLYLIQTSGLAIAVQLCLSNNMSDGRLECASELAGQAAANWLPWTDCKHYSWYDLYLWL